MGFLLICMGAQFCINGIKEVAQDPVFHGEVQPQHLMNLLEEKAQQMQSELSVREKSRP